MATTSSTTPLSFNDSPFGFYGHPSGTERQAHTSNNDQQRYLTMSTVPSSHSSAQAPMQSSHQQQQASPYSQSPSWNTNQLHGFFGTGLFDQTQQQPQQAYYLQRQTPSQPTQHSSLLPPYLVDSPMEQSSTNHPATSSYAQSEDSVQSSPNAVNPQNQFSTPLPTNATGPSQQDADVSTLDFDQEASGSDSARSPTPAATQAAQGAKWGPKAKRKSNPHFVTKLFYMLEGGAWDHVVRWSFNGDSFIVVNMEDFTKDVLPYHFKHSNFSSFVRQLNKYDFHKMKKDPAMLEKLFGITPGHSKRNTFDHIWEFKHHCFRAGRADMLPAVRRKVPVTKKAVEPRSVSEEGEGSPSTVALGSEATNTEDYAQLKEQIVGLKAIQKSLTQHLSTLTEKYQGVMSDMDRVQANMAQQDQLVQHLLAHLGKSLPIPTATPISPHAPLSLVDSSTSPTLSVTSATGPEEILGSIASSRVSSHDVN